MIIPHWETDGALRFASQVVSVNYIAGGVFVFIKIKNQLMQEQRPFPPPYGLTKGYPYNGINSVRFLNPLTERTKVITLDEEQPKPTERQINFILDSLRKHSQALEIAEQQLADIFEERPFIPSAFGFITA